MPKFIWNIKDLKPQPTYPIKIPILSNRAQDREDYIKKTLKEQIKIGMTENSKSIGIRFSGFISKVEM